MAIGLLTPEDHDDVASFADRAESLGYDALWVTELWGRDAFVALTRAAERTDAIDLGTAIVNAYGRSPATLAQAAATLADAAGGRVRLGVGTSTEKVVEDLHGMVFDNPPRRLHETVELAKAFLEADGRVEYDGEIFDVADFPSLETPLPVYAAALGPANRRATGRVADGWLPHNIPFDRLSETFETIAETASDAGRDPEDITVAPYVPCAVSEDPDEAIAAVRNHLAYYLGSSDGYKNAAALSFADEAEAVAAAWRSGDRDDARAAVTDEMLHQLAIVGTPSTARDRFDDLASRDVVDDVIVTIPMGVGDELRDRTVEELAPDA
jgi:alkanesulfonate monooxygenase SsuD/methylene tetrahydromethanopterin reductase-like flavin-dependent oxidoreductase (luciferase family)